MANFLGRPTNFLYIWRNPAFRDSAVIVASDADAARELWSGQPYVVRGEPDNVYELAGYSRPQEMCFGRVRMTTYERGTD